MCKVKKYALLMLLCFALALVGCSSSVPVTYEQISGDEAKALMDSESDYIIIDARTQEEYDANYRGRMSDGLLAKISREVYDAYMA